MTWELVGQILVAAIGAWAAFVQVKRVRSGAKGLRALIRQDVELYNVLPEESAARKDLLAHIERSVSKLIFEDTTLRREPFGIGLGVAIGVIGLVAAWYAIDLGSIWSVPLWIAAAFLLTLAIAGVADSSVKSERDEKGRVIRKPKDTQSASTESSNDELPKI